MEKTCLLNLSILNFSNENERVFLTDILCISTYIQYINFKTNILYSSSRNQRFGILNNFVNALFQLFQLKAKLIRSIQSASLHSPCSLHAAPYAYTPSSRLGVVVAICPVCVPGGGGETKPGMSRFKRVRMANVTS